MALTVHYNEEGLADSVPTFLFDQAETYYGDPRSATLEWFSAAFLGLSVFYGLPALTGEHEDLRKGRDELEALQRHFTAKGFDAMEIVQLAIAAGARYLLFPACYDDGFCLFGSELTGFTSSRAPAQRDLVAEVASVCEYHGIGLFLEYSLSVNAHRHPDGVPQEAAAEYTDFVRGQLHELFTGYGTVAGICFGGLRRLKAQLPSFDAADLYAMVRHLQPHALVAFREGFNGTEDFFSVKDAIPQEPGPFLAKNSKCPVEIRCSLAQGGRSYSPAQAGKHLDADAVWKALAEAHRVDANLLVNTALMPDGSLDAEDIGTLVEVGRRLETRGRP